MMKKWLLFFHFAPVLLIAQNLSSPQQGDVTHQLHQLGDQISQGQEQTVNSLQSLEHKLEKLIDQQTKMIQHINEIANVVQWFRQPSIVYPVTPTNPNQQD